MACCKADDPLNTSFPITNKQAKVLLKEMRAAPVAFERPVIIACGIYDPGFLTGHIGKQLKKVTNDDVVMTTVSFNGMSNFDRCRERLIERIERVAPCDDAQCTTEVDVVAFSMGGLVSRYAALPRDDGGKRVKIRRLFTISTPHLGADWAQLPTLDQRVKDMRTGSAFLSQLNAALPQADYALYPYTRLNDKIVGTTNTAPPGYRVWWVDEMPFQLSHVNAVRDARITADIARRLRGQTPLTTDPPAPLPEEGNPDAGTS
jgi:hypothetical protein